MSDDYFSDEKRLLASHRRAIRGLKEIQAAMESEGVPPNGAQAAIVTASLYFLSMKILTHNDPPLFYEQIIEHLRGRLGYPKGSEHDSLPRLISFDDDEQP